MNTKTKYPRLDLGSYRAAGIRKGLAMYGFSDSTKYGRRYSMGLFWPQLEVGTDIFTFRTKPRYKPLWLLTIIGFPFMLLLFIVKRLLRWLSDRRGFIPVSIVIIVCVLIGLVKEMERNRVLSQDYKWRYVQMEYVRLWQQKRVIDSVMKYSAPRDSAFYQRVAVEMFLKHNDQVKALKTELFQIPVKDSVEFNSFAAHLSIKL